jgi:hypothetical protein
MSLVDNNLFLGYAPTITNSNTGKVFTVASGSGNDAAYDAGSSIKLFESRNPSIRIDIPALAIGTAGAADCTVLVQLMGATDTSYTSEAPIATWYSAVRDDGTTAIGTGGISITPPPMFPTGQLVARRYYYLKVTLGGTTPDLTAGTIPVYGQSMNGQQTNLPNTRAAAPA